MTVGDRVGFAEDGIRGLQLGTVTRVTPGGYVRVAWDDGTEGRFSPALAAARLQPVTGDDAKPRHDWITNTDPICDRCGLVQTDANEFEACQA